jgi:uncharacterized protein (DUF58 family)
MNHNSEDRFYRSFYNRFQSGFEQPPLSPWAKLGVAIVTVAVLTVSFMLGLVFLAIAVGLLAMGMIALTIRRLIAGRQKPQDDDNIEVTYRVIHRRRDD